ncbi:MAG: beta-propeller fold lactonase family protein [Terriglobales bacterium]
MRSKVAFGLLLAVFVVTFAVAKPRWMRQSRVPTNVAYVSEEEGAISVIDLSTLKIIRRVETGEIAPRGLAVTFDGKYVVTANKNTQDVAVFSTDNLSLTKRLHIGENPEFIKINPAGNRVFATFEPASQHGPPPSKSSATPDDANEPPAQIASFHVGNWSLGPVSAAGPETEGVEFSRDGKLMVVANEAQETVGVFTADTGAHVRDIDLKGYGIRPRGVKISPQGNEYAVTMEASGTLLTMDQNFNVIKAVPTAAKPYGVAFDRAGKRIFVSAEKLQVFSADSLQLLAEVPTGKRCWHFTFTPDDSKILVACGRSNNVVIIDANSYKPLGSIDGFKLPWGIVAYPRSYGSLGLP